jgi:hypothetical protein
MNTICRKKKWITLHSGNLLTYSGKEWRIKQFLKHMGCNTVNLELNSLSDNIYLLVMDVKKTEN